MRCGQNLVGDSRADAAGRLPFIAVDIDRDAVQGTRRDRHPRPERGPAPAGPVAGRRRARKLNAAVGPEAESVAPGLLARSEEPEGGDVAVLARPELSRHGAKVAFRREVILGAQGRWEHGNAADDVPRRPIQVHARYGEAHGSGVPLTVPP